MSRNSKTLAAILLLLLSLIGLAPTLAWNLPNTNRRVALESLVSQWLFLGSTSTAQAATSTELPPITHRVAMSVRISRKDGTFYVRDEQDEQDKVFQGTLQLGLFGTAMPKHVETFLSYITNMDDESPNYSRSSFTSFDDSTGLLVGGSIPALEVTTLGGSAALKYGSRIRPAALWLDQASSISHTQKGLLTHRRLDVTPAFGITTRAAPELDATHSVFGQVLLNEDSNEFLRRVMDVPTYQVHPLTTSNPKTAVFNAQRDWFRGAAQTLGDTRLDKLYNGKLLRRIQVTQIRIL